MSRQARLSRALRRREAVQLLGVLGASALLLPGCGFEAAPLFDEPLTPGDLGTVQIASPAEALTFARARIGDDVRVIAVRSYESGVVSGVDLEKMLGRSLEDPAEAFRVAGYERLETIASTAAVDVSVPLSELMVPAALGAWHVAAGTNFPEHASDTGVDKGPFLFPKLVEPSSARGTVAVRNDLAGAGLLDYEVEIAWVTLEPLEPGRGHPKFFGLVLCNDFTDRDTLLRRIDPSRPESGAGFTTGKSFPGYLPVGDLFVIPKDHRRFAASLELRLAVNGRLRQRDGFARAVWKLDDLIDETWKRSHVTWEHRGRAVSLFPGNAPRIEPRTLFLSGTPAGTVFTSVTVEQKFTAFFDWILGGWGTSIPRHAIDRYIRDVRAAGVYLAPGDVVTIHVDRMGTLENRVVEG